MSQNRQPRNQQQQTTTETSQDLPLRLSGTLRLRGEDAPSVTPEPSSSRRIRWSEDVVDNEGMGKKSSKVCCIYHKARPVGESSSESESSSSSSDSDSDSEIDRRRARPNNHSSHPRGRGLAGEEGASDQSQDQASAVCPQHRHRHSKPKRKPSPNAYEKMPRSSKNSSRGT
ncbi:Type 1 phosphatases regulator ypi1 [Penicillium odoratum]|uniref:Type 1 phosphatases regulator ypi1 n=1 Tax=Penicillium odoratum TaxID=1167516 RepID=UPI00254893C7|nr:Type 1 phosphatases regulator ypi1 [Penicillium odoratum]KAJ5768813.1 Type 1 phosphatases regulator ypi1 [Penicillium odoratum]